MENEPHIKVGGLSYINSQNGVPMSSSSCYDVVLNVANTDDNDRRDYKVVVENSYGVAEGLVTLEVCLLD